MAELEQGQQAVKSVLPNMRVALGELRKVAHKMQPFVQEHSRAGAANFLVFAHTQTLKAIIRLLGDGLYADAFTLLRPMFQGFLQLFCMCSGTEAEARRFLLQPAIREWRRVRPRPAKAERTTSPAPEPYAKQAEQNYKLALAEFNAEPGSFPRGLTERSMVKLVNRVDQAEGPGGYCQKLYDRLWACGGSEAVHRSLYGIVDTVAAVTCPAGKAYMGPSPSVGLEAAVLSMLMTYRGAAWLSLVAEFEEPKRLGQLEREAREIAVRWVEARTAKRQEMEAAGTQPGSGTKGKAWTPP